MIFGINTTDDISHVVNPALIVKRSRDGLSRYDFFPLSDELSDDTVENFVIGDSSSDDGS